MTDPVIDAPVIDSSWPVSDATDTYPAVTVPRTPPPAPLLTGETRAADGGIEGPTVSGGTPESGPPGSGSRSGTSEGSAPATGAAPGLPGTASA